ncbi:hypothetical protein ACM41_26430 [Bradyrhizobium sp. CCBAU 21362]|uniref:hypothetical protein n=1 Tax=Bradyrhizobium sp. CCBAU 21362 TaxID=1325082 RepID=UPI0023059884|nr:hypothetical protein [Bradyrhizobium sp. CCBAU 21362]MDA9539640.1 hypothetical protein [Bradyrhizobium sp. CCBAU 21362]
MTDPNAFSALGCNSAVAVILAGQIDAGRSDANEICGVSFCDYEALEIARQVNGGRGEAQPLEALGLLPELANAIAGAINARSDHE